MAGLISPSTLEQIRASSDIVEVIGGYFPLKRAGANFVALCPFHKEKSASFSVNPHRQIFYCFGCHKGGDVFSFVQAYENLSFLEAVRRLAERARIPLEFLAGMEPAGERSLKETLLQMHEQITQRWQIALAQDAAGQPARDYLKQRGVAEEAVKLFRLGFAPNVWDDTVNWAKSKGYDLPLVEKAGLILHRENEARYYDRFRGRLMFPIGDEQGRIIGFSGRILAGDQKSAKYVNSPETPLFVKGKVIFGLDKTKRALLDQGFAIICEGQLDLITCYLAGVRNVAAPQGTALTADQVRILKRYVDEVVLCFDADAAGRNAAIRALDDLLASGLAIRVATIPPPHDPDSFIKSFGGAAFQELITKAESFFDFYLNHLCSGNDIGTDKGRLAVVQAMAEAVHKTNHPVLVDTYAQKTGYRLRVAPDAIRSEFHKLRSPKTRPKTEAASESHSTPPETHPPSPQESWLLKLLLVEESLAEWAARRLDVDWLQHAGIRAIVARRLALVPPKSWPGVAGFLAQERDEPTSRMISAAVADPRPIVDPQQRLQEIILRLRNQHLSRQLALLSQALKSELPLVEQQEIVRQQIELRQRKGRPLEPLGE